ncbi:MAG: aldose epimerase [Calothrix sp. MO_167.B42]|nr:aldose epimerase [Calothrix sp. MO_167.B42]
MNKLNLQTQQSQLEVLPARGGIITSWQVQGQEIFYLDKERLANPELSIRGGIPILFPICGDLPDNTYTHNGQQYTLKQHGFARNLPWEVIQQEASPQQAWAMLRLESNEQTKAVYPFEFQLQFTYQIQGNTLEIRQEYANLSSTPMPFSAGFHPYFHAPDKSQLEFAIPSNQYQEKGSKEIVSFGGNFDFQREEIDFAFGNLNGNSSCVTDKGRKLQLVMEWDDIFSTFVFWTLKGKDFYCAEPWTAPRNALNTGEHLTILAPGATQTATIRLITKFL